MANLDGKVRKGSLDEYLPYAFNKDYFRDEEAN